MKTCLGRASLAAMLIFGAARANAQITTVVASPKRAATNQQEIIRREQVAQDSIARTTLTGMTQWVDSAAAALALHPDTGAVPASTATVTVPARPDSARADTRSASSQPAPSAPAAQTPEFRDRARAPDTATAIPTVALIGGVMALVGLLIRRRPTALKVRVRR